MGLLTFGLNVTLDGCIDPTQGIADDELHDYWTQLMDQSGAMLFGRNTYELSVEGPEPSEPAVLGGGPQRGNSASSAGFSSVTNAGPPTPSAPSMPTKTP